LLCNVAARDAELDQLKMLVKQLADKVNAPGDSRRSALPRWKAVLTK
jgi:ribosomal protein S11